MSTETSNNSVGLFSELEEYIKDSAELTKLEKFINEALDNKPIQYYFVWQTMEKPRPDDTGEPVETIKATIISDSKFFEFIYSAGRYRYDVSPLDIFFRIEEIHYAENSLDGKAVPAIKARVDGKHQSISQHYFVKGEKTAQLKKFLKVLRKLIQF